MASDNDLLEFFTWLKNRGMIVNVFIGEYELIDEYKNSFKSLYIPPVNYR